MKATRIKTSNHKNKQLKKSSRATDSYYVRMPLHYRLMRRGSFVALLVFLGVFFGMALTHLPESDATGLNGWNPGRIIDDAIFYNPDTMTVAEIDQLIKDKTPSCDTWGTGEITDRPYPGGVPVPRGTTRAEYAKNMREKYGRMNYHEPPYICLDSYYENPQTHENTFDSKGIVKPGMISAAQIFYNAAHEHGINPQVLLVMLKKESSIWNDNWPFKTEYDTVMGYGCPDGAPCDEKYFGFQNQINKAAWQLNYYREHINEYNYRPFMTNQILYAPVTDKLNCGTKSVYLENVATTSLYIYTPYTPNDAAIQAYPGTGDKCSSYGNRNFYGLFKSWFGDTIVKEEPVRADHAKLDAGDYRIVTSANKANTLQADANGIIVQGAKTSGDSDIFKVSGDTATLSYMFAQKSSTKVFDVPESKAQDGQYISLYRSHSEKNQKWYLYDNHDGTYSIATALNPALVLDYSNKQIALRRYDAKKASQKFSFLKTDVKVIDSSKNYRLESVAKRSKVIDIWGDVKDNKSAGIVAVFRNKQAESDNQTFNFLYDTSDGFYRIKNSASDLYLTLGQTRTDSLADLTLALKKDGCAQKWNIYTKDNGNMRIASACNSYNLDLDVAQDKVSVYRHHGRDNQYWRLVEPAKRPLENGSYSITSVLDPDYSINSRGFLQDITLAKNKQKFTFTYDSYWGDYIITSADGYALDLNNNGRVNGTSVLSFHKHGQSNQHWTLVPSSDGSFQIESTHVRGKNIDIWENRPSAGRLHIWDAHGHENQRWLIQK